MSETIKLVEENRSYKLLHIGLSDNLFLIWHQIQPPCFVVCHIYSFFLTNKAFLAQIIII